LKRARDGVALDATEAEILLSARGDALADLCASAARVRDQGLADAGRPGVITYSKKVFIPLARLCRDRCHYCTFATTPKRLAAPFLSPDEVLAIASQGAALGCKEALFTLGDRPEERWPVAREWLDAHGYDSTLAYVRAMAILVLERTGLLPHLNPGVMSWAELQRLKPVAPSMGMMLETTSRTLFEDPHGAHYGSPDKDPHVRLRVLEDAGRSAVPFTTGLLIGIGETPADRVESLFAIRRIARAYDAIQETIVQNFRAKPDTAMARMPDAELGDLAATVAVARLVLGPRMRIQAPPNLIGEEFRRLMEAGIDDWGGVSPLTPDHVNPERPWPQIDELAAHTAASGFRLVERLTVYPRYVLAGEPWLDPRVVPHVAALTDPASGLARADAPLLGRPWQEPDETWTSTGRVDLHTAVDSEGRTEDRRSDFDSVYGDWATVATAAQRTGAPVPFDSDIAAALRAAERDPAGISDAEALSRLAARGGGHRARCGRGVGVGAATGGGVADGVRDGDAPAPGALAIGVPDMVRPARPGSPRHAR
jgi:FO synthase